jgi:hypothetical protein
MKRFLSVFFSLFLIFSSAVTADETGTETFVLDDFSGGLASKVSPLALPSKYATVAENLRFNSKYKSISRRANLNVYGSADATEAITGMFRHYKKDGTKVLVVTHGDEMEKGNDTTGVFTQILPLTTGDRRWQFVTWHDILIGTDGYNRPVKYDGTSSSATYLGSLLATDAGSGSGPATGSYTYKVACYSTTYTVLLNSASNTITANGNDVSLSMIPICPDVTLNGEATTGRKIYRTESNGSSYKLLSNGTIANNTDVTLTDSDADAALGAAMPAGDATWSVPTARFILVQNNRLFLANDPTNSPSRIWYSSEGSHDIFDSSNESSYLDIRQDDGDTITCLQSVLGILTVCKDNSIQKIYIDGTDPDADWSISDPLSSVGCHAPYSVSDSPLGMIYLHDSGIYRFNGQYSELISETVTPEIEDINPTNLENTWGIYHNNTYYLAYNSQESGGGTNNRVLILDILGKAFSIDRLNINAFVAFNSGNDWGVLYAGASDSGEVYAFSSEVNEVMHNEHSDFTGLWDDMRYIPTDIGGDADSPVLEIARTETINELSGLINDLVGIIDRQDTLGHYISQPLQIDASSLDKIYWNEQIPATGGNVTFQVRTSNTGESNLLLNDDFEFWDNWVTGSPTREEPNDWTFAQDGTGGSADQSTTEVKRGTYSAKITKSDSGQSYISTSLRNPTNYQSKTLAFSGWAKSANSVASKVRIQITDGFTTTTTNYANGGAWEELEGTIAVNAAATAITIKCVVETGADAVAYFDRVMVRESSNVTNDWSAWSSAVTDSAGSDISGVTTGDYVQYMINLETTDIDYTPTIVRVGEYNVRLTYFREGTPEATDISMHYTSGWLTLGHPSRPKLIRGIEVYHTGTEGSFTVTISNFEGDSDAWTISLTDFPEYYKEYSTGGALRGEMFQVDILYDEGVEPFTVDKIVIHYDTEPFV